MEPQAQPSQPTEAEVAAVIALILAGQAPEQVAAAKGVGAAIETALLLLVPASLPSALKSSVSREAAALVLRDQSGPPNGSGAVLVAERSNLVYRALYGINAVGRIVRAIAQGSGKVEEKLKTAVDSEGRYFAAHKEASGRRLKAAAMVDAATDLYGPVLGWNHGPNGPGDRPHHLKADGLNFDPLKPPRETEGLPGTLLNCKCFVGPPKEGARVMR